MVEDIVKECGLPYEPNNKFSVLNVYYIPEKHSYYRIIRVDFDSLNDDEKNDIRLLTMQQCKGNLFD